MGLFDARLEWGDAGMEQGNHCTGYFVNGRKVGHIVHIGDGGKAYYGTEYLGHFPDYRGAVARVEGEYTRRKGR